MWRHKLGKSASKVDLASRTSPVRSGSLSIESRSRCSNRVCHMSTHVETETKSRAVEAIRKENFNSAAFCFRLARRDDVIQAEHLTNLNIGFIMLRQHCGVVSDCRLACLSCGGYRSWAARGRARLSRKGGRTERVIVWRSTVEALSLRSGVAQETRPLRARLFAKPGSTTSLDNNRCSAPGLRRPGCKNIAAKGKS